MYSPWGKMLPMHDYFIAVVCIYEHNDQLNVLHNNYAQTFEYRLLANAEHYK